MWKNYCNVRIQGWVGTAAWAGFCHGEKLTIRTISVRMNSESYRTMFEKSVEIFIERH